ncbi:MAG: hypothetical protein ABWY19_15200 [Marmoricola sp.]
MRPILVLVLLAGLAVVPGPAAARPGATGRADGRGTREVLHAWDERRAVAWARSEEAELRSLYAPGSGAGRADVRMLRSWTSRGLVVRRLVTQVFGVRVLRHEPGAISLRVLDRVAGGLVSDGRREWPLRSSPPAVRRVDLVLVAGDWRVAAVTGWG